MGHTIRPRGTIPPGRCAGNSRVEHGPVEDTPRPRMRPGRQHTALPALPESGPVPSVTHDGRGQRRKHRGASASVPQPMPLQGTSDSFVLPISHPTRGDTSRGRIPGASSVPAVPRTCTPRPGSAHRRPAEGRSTRQARGARTPPGAGGTAATTGTGPNAPSNRPPSVTTLAPMATPAHRFRTACGSPASAVTGIAASIRQPTNATTTILRIEAPPWLFLTLSDADWFAIIHAWRLPDHTTHLQSRQQKRAKRVPGDHPGSAQLGGRCPIVRSVFRGPAACADGAEREVTSGRDVIGRSVAPRGGYFLHGMPEGLTGGQTNARDVAPPCDPPCRVRTAPMDPKTSTADPKRSAGRFPVSVQRARNRVA